MDASLGDMVRWQRSSAAEELLEDAVNGRYAVGSAWAVLLVGGAAGLLLTSADLAAAEAATRPWRDQVVAPLRAVRRTLRGDVGQVTAGSAVALRTRIQAVELEAERVQQAVLQGLGPAPGAAARAAAEAAVATNIGFYLRRLGAAANSPPTGLIAVAAAPVGR